MAEPIELRLSNLTQLYHTLDPAPFREGDLDATAEAYIVDWARELPRDAPLAIVIHLPAEELAKPGAAEVPQSVRHFFAERAQSEAKALRELFRFGRAALALGLVVLAACLGAAVLAARLPLEGPLARLVPESLVIVGWVALWRPAEVFLYDWMPIVRRRRLYARLAVAGVEL
ncbi:MAG: hypothetical protein MUC64_07145, partial [Rubritepida sp.]|nr:hypothetical protein [Rubritepida sp.]